MISRIDAMVPLPGYCLVDVESRVVAMEQVSGLVVPERFRRSRGVVGQIVAVSMRPVDRRHMGVDLQPGQWALLVDWAGARVQDTIYRYPLSWRHPQSRDLEFGILALTDDPSLIGMVEEVARCRWCGPCRQGSTQAMILVDGVCPRCMRDAHGDRHASLDPDPAEGVDDRMVADLEEEKARRMGTLRASDTVYSLPSR